jgi:POTRA domain, FtsQ-type/Cell division protein FtsQ
LAKRERTATPRRPREHSLARPLFQLVLVVIAQAIFLTSSLFRLHTVTVSGNKILTRREILQAAHLRYNVLLYKVPLRDIEARIKKLHWVHEVAVRRSLPSQISIRISERNPVLAVRNTDETSEFPQHWFVVSADGVVLTQADAALHERLPRCCLPVEMEIGQTLPPQQVNHVLSVRKALPPQLEADVLELRADADEQFEMLYRLMGKPTKIRIGSAEQIKDKFTKLGHLLAELPSGEAPPTYIDLRFEEPAVGYPAPRTGKGHGKPAPPGSSPAKAAPSSSPGAASSPSAPPADDPASSPSAHPVPLRAIPPRAHQGEKRP